MSPFAVWGPPAYGRRRLIRQSIIAAALLALAIPAQAAPLRLLALGDSLTAGFGLPPGQGFVPRLQAALREAGQDVRVLDAGVSGDTTAGGLARLDWALAESPHAALVELGGNDGLRGLPPAQSYANLKAILGRLAERRIPTLLSGMIAPPNLGAEYGREFTAIYTRLRDEYPGLVFDPFFLEGVAGDPALNQADGIHPNAQGVQVVVRRLLPAVQALLLRVTP